MAARDNADIGPSFGISRATGFGKDVGPSPRRCRWPSWKNEDRPSHRYCGKQVKPGSPYCPHHHGLAYQVLRSSATEAEHHGRVEAEYATPGKKP